MKEIIIDKFEVLVMPSLEAKGSVRVVTLSHSSLFWIYAKTLSNRRDGTKFSFFFFQSVLPPYAGLSPVALIFTPVTNLLLCECMVSVKGNITCNIKHVSSPLSHNKCYGLQLLITMFITDWIFSVNLTNLLLVTFSLSLSTCPVPR